MFDVWAIVSAESFCRTFGIGITNFSKFKNDKCFLTANGLTLNGNDSSYGCAIIIHGD